MKMNSRCLSCIISKQELKVRDKETETIRLKYLKEVARILSTSNEDDTMPWLSTKVDELYASMFHDDIDYATIKHHYNLMMLNQEDVLRNRINDSDDSLYLAIQLARVGNYIDYGALDNVESNILDELIENAQQDLLSTSEYDHFKKDLADAHKLLYICDNCGEIVLDKLLIEVLKSKYPNLHITVMVRGGEVINDASMIDAKQVGIDKICRVIDNGIAMAGTDIKHISSKAKQELDEADMIISKGQANFETLFANGYPIYYLLLCKCDLFVSRFQMEKLKGVFVKEDRITIND